MEVSPLKSNVVQTKTEPKKHHIRASIAGITAGAAVQAASVPLAMSVLSAMSKIGNLPQDKIDILHNAAEKAIKETGLASKGVNIEYVPQTKSNIPWFAKLTDTFEQIREGRNAGFLNTDFAGYAKNTILMPEKGISFAAFHEIGHSMNYNMSKFGKFIQNCRVPGLVTTGLIIAYGMLTRKSRPKDGEKLTTAQKINNFIRNNAGKLSFAALVPMLAEEAMATSKGLKLAKKFVSPELFKTVAKGSKVAYLSYLISALGLSLSALVTVKVKDAIAAKQDAKAAAKAAKV